MKVTNEAVWGKAKTELVSEQVRRRRWRLFEHVQHVLRMEREDNQRTSLIWAKGEGVDREGHDGVQVEKEWQHMGLISRPIPHVGRRDWVLWRRRIAQRSIVVGPLVLLAGSTSTRAVLEERMSTDKKNLSISYHIDKRGTHIVVEVSWYKTVFPKFYSHS